MFRGSKVAEPNNLNENDVADFLKAIAHPTRIKILKTIYEKDFCVNDISEKLKLNQPNTSQHLAILKDKNLLIKVKRGNEVCYKVKTPEIIKFIEEAANLIEKLTES